MSAMILTLEASFFLLKANLGLSPTTIAKLSIPHLDYHEENFKSLARQSANTRVGMFLLLVSFALQMGNALWPLSWKDFGIDWHGVLISIGLCIIILVLADQYSRFLSNKIYDRSIEIIKTNPKD
jgi:hypothetical protein